jgi:SAM-dependent methyltransferase
MNAERSLQEIYDDLAQHYNQGGDVAFFSDKGTVHSYIDFYEHYFSRKRDRVRLLEIGLMSGSSFLIWSRYFKNYRLIGIDIAPDLGAPRDFHAELESDPDIQLYLGLDSTKDYMPNELRCLDFDFIIDDGNHEFWAQILTLQSYWPLLVPGGVYFIEDVMGDGEIQQFRKLIATIYPGATVDHHPGFKDDRADDQILAITKNGRMISSRS